MKLYGDTITLTADFVSLQHPGMGVKFLNIRNGNGNDVVWLSNNGTTVIGFLNAGEAREFVDLSTGTVFVKGTVGQPFYWDAEGW